MKMRGTFSNFANWFNRIERTALGSPVGVVAAAAGFDVTHTGGHCLAWESGHCLAWEKSLAGGRYLWICDLGNGLGDSIDEHYLVGLYNQDADVLDEGKVDNLQAALDWCKAHEAVAS
jgi:hypothetical protein